MTTYRVTFEITPPVPATKEQVEEWVRFQVGSNGDIELENPLSDYDMEGRYVFVN